MAFSPYIIMLEMSSIDITLRFFHEKQLDAYAFDCWLLFRRFGVWWAEVYSYSVFSAGLRNVCSYIAIRVNS